jgi:imidazoleglycerol-phosphate dehydratase
VVELRKAKIQRKTKETKISAQLNIDGKGKAKIKYPIGFLSHMLELLTHHGLFDLTLEASGDLHVDQHHLVEDTGIVLGQAFGKALGNKGGIRRYGWAAVPMDEALALAVIDISARPMAKIDYKHKRRKIGDFSAELVIDFFEAFAANLVANIHINLLAGRSEHHKVEAMFKAFARALRQACEIEPRLKGKVPSTKGKL